MVNEPQLLLEPAPMWRNLLPEPGAVRCIQVGDEWEVTITTKQPALVQIMALLQVMSGLSEDIRRHIRRVETDQRAAHILAQHRASVQAVVDMYWQIRRTGVKHRKAIELLAESPLAQQLRFNKQEINWAVKTYNAKLKEV